MVRKNFIFCFKTSFQALLDPVVSHPPVHTTRPVFRWSPCPACHPSRQAGHEPPPPGSLPVLATSFQQLQSDYFMRWDTEWGCLGNPRGQFQFDLWAAGPLQSLIPKDITLSSLVPEPVLVLISLLSFCSPAMYDPVFSFSNLSGSSHHVKQRADLAWKNAVNCFLKT